MSFYFACPDLQQVQDEHGIIFFDKEFTYEINFTFRHFPVITRQSPKTAEAGQCASIQVRSWDYHDYIYKKSTPTFFINGQQVSFSYKAMAATIQQELDS